MIEYEGVWSDWERIGYESSAPTWYAVSEDGARKRTTLVRKRAEEVPFSEKFKMEFCRLMGREEQNNYCKITESRVNYR